MVKRLANLLLCLTMFFMKSYAQEKVTLTKEETVNYINKKLSESIGHWKERIKSSSGGYFPGWKMASVSVSISGCNLFISYTYDSDEEDETMNETFKFDPKSISSVYSGYDSAKYGRNPVVCKAVVRLKSSQALGTFTNYKWPHTNRSSSTSYVEVPFLSSDETNLDKIRKAFYHLRDLCKAEDDPFGN